VAFYSGWRMAVPSLEGATPLKIRFGELFETRVRLGLVGVAVAVIGTVHLVRRDGWLFTTERESLGVGVALVFGGFIVMTEAAIEAVVFRVDEPHVLDTLIVETAFIVVTMAEMAPAWRRADVSRYFIDRFEHLAVTVENLPLARRVPLLQVGLHGKVHRPVKRLSGVIRAHKRAIAEVASREAYDRILNSLVAGFMAMVREDWSMLLANTESVNLRRWYLGYIPKNLIPAFVLASVAIVLPWLPPFRGHMASLLGIRITLGLYAVMRLIPGVSLTDLVDRGLSRGFDPLKGK